MPDDTFRPRRPLDPDDFDDSGIADEETIKSNIAKNIQDRKIQRAAAAAAAIGQIPSNDLNVPAFAENPSAPQVLGNVPSEFLQHVKAQKGESVEPKRGFSQMANQTQAPRQLSNNQSNTVHSSHLKEILEGIRGIGQTYEEIELPSRGRFYDGSDGPTSGIVSIRPMTGEEEQILATPRLVHKGQAVNLIFEKCLKERFKTENFLTIDRTYLLIYLRGISYTPQYDVEVKCPDCEKKFPTTIDLNWLNVEQCPDNFGPELQDVLPTTNLPFSYRLSRGRDEQEILDHRERKSKTYGDAAVDDSLIFRMAQLLNHIDGLSNKEQLKVLLKNLPINDVSYIRNTINEPPFGVDTNVEILCPMCMHEFDVDLPLEAGFFFPRRRKTKTQA